MKISKQVGFANTILVLVTFLLGTLYFKLYAQTMLIELGILCGMMTEIIIDTSNALRELKNVH